MTDPVTGPDQARATAVEFAAQVVNGTRLHPRFVYEMAAAIMWLDTELSDTGAGLLPTPWAGPAPAVTVHLPGDTPPGWFRTTPVPEAETARRALLRRRHRRLAHPNHVDEQFCYADHQTWPCTMISLLNQLEAAEGVARWLTAHHDDLLTVLAAAARPGHCTECGCLVAVPAEVPAPGQDRMCGTHQRLTQLATELAGLQ